MEALRDPACGEDRRTAARRWAMRIIAFILEPPVIERILGQVGQPPEPPVILPARSPPQGELVFDQDGGRDDWPEMDQSVGKPVGDWPMPDLLLVFFIAIVALSGLVIPLGVLFARLVVRVNTINLDISFWPLDRKAVATSEIVSFEATDYKAVRQYGRWGIKHGKDGRWAYNVSGNRFCRASSFRLIKNSPDWTSQG